VEQLQEMQEKLIAVAEDLTGPIEDAARADAEDTDLEDESDDADGADTPVDPRYEDLWVNTEGSLQLPDLASIDLDFDDEE
jgi:hypothetical protein